MRTKCFLLLFVTLFLVSCGSSQRITATWINPEAKNNSPYEKLFVMVLTPSTTNSFSIEDKMAEVISNRGQEYVVSSSIFPPKVKISDTFTREQMKEAIERTGSDAVFVIALLDVSTTETYYSGNNMRYAPYNYPYYGSYYGYYNHYYPYTYSPGYYSTDKTYYIETNFYDVAEDKLLWSMQSEAYNPVDLESWFDTYARQLLYELKNEELISEE